MHNFTFSAKLKIKLYSIWWFILLITIPNILLAQKHGQARLDSLLTVVNRPVQDTNVVNSLISISTMYKNINTQQGLGYAEKALSLATKLKWQKGIGYGNYNLGNSYFYTNNFDKALFFYKKAADIADQFNFIDLKFKVLNVTGSLYDTKKDYENAISFYKKQIDLGLKMRDPENFNQGCQSLYNSYVGRKIYDPQMAYFNELVTRCDKPGLEVFKAYATQFVGDVFFVQRKYKEGIAYFEKALKILDGHDNYATRGRIMEDIAGAHLNMKDTITALKYYPVALKLYQQAPLFTEQQTVLNSMVLIYANQKDEAIIAKYSDLVLAACLRNEDYQGYAALNNAVIFYYLTLNKPEAAAKYIDNLLKIPKEGANKYASGNSFYYLGNVYAAQKKYKQALDNYQESINSYQQVNELYQMRSSYVQMANLYLSMKNYSQALSTLQKEIVTAKKMGDKIGLAAADMYMGGVYEDINDHNNALRYYDDAGKLYEEANSYSGQAYSYNSKAITYNNSGEYDKAIENGLAGLKLAEDNQIRSYMGLIPNSIATSYYKKGDYDAALKYALLSDQTSGVFFDKAPTYITLANIISEAPDDVLTKYGTKPSERYQKTLFYLNQSNLSNRAFKNKNVTRDYWKATSESYVKLNDYGKAYDAYKKYIDYRDSALLDRNHTDFVQKQMEFDYNKRADSINFQQRLTSEKLKQQTLLATQQRQSLLLNQQQFSLVKKEKDLQQLGFLKTQAELQAEQSRRKANDQKLKTAQKEQALTEANFQLQKAELGSKRTQNRFFIGGLVALVILSFFIGLNYYNQRKSNLVIIAANKQTDIQREAAEGRLAELKAAQNQLIQSEKMASLGELTAGIAHEIQNPLNFVNNFSEVSIELLDEMQEELNNGNPQEAMAIAADLKNNLEKIGTHGKRADFIVKGMLQHSRTNKGERQPTNVNMLADEFFKLSYHGLRAKDKSFNAELITDFKDDLPKVNVVQQDVGRVLLNLFNNAFYAVQQKQKTAGSDYRPTVEVSTTSLKNAVMITVKDNGVGIPDSIREKIMQPFFTTKPTGQGTGLGLSLSYDIVVKGHGGEIKIDSKEGEFTIFNIILPV